MKNSAEHPSWGECVGEMVICDVNGWNGPDDAPWRCTGGTHIAPGKYIRCVSSYHDRDAPLVAGVGLTVVRTTPERTRYQVAQTEYTRAMVSYEAALQGGRGSEIAAASARLDDAHRVLCAALANVVEVHR